MARTRRQLGEILKRWGLVDDQQIEEAAKIAQGSRKRIGDVLTELGYAQQNDVAKALASQFDMEFVDLDRPNVVHKENLPLIPVDIIKKYTVLPMGQEGNVLKVLVHDPMNLELIDNLQFRLGCKIELALGARSKIKEYIDSMLSETKATIDETVRELSMDQSLDRGASLDIQFAGDANEDELNEDLGADDTPIIKLVNQIIAEAVQSRSSDIHIEPFENRVRLRYRIDGVCVERNVIPKRVQGSVTARMKILSGMRVEERRIPQDGRIKMKIAGDTIDFRVSACPVYHGESIVLRILRPDAASLGLEKLGMQPDTLETFNEIITRPNGIFLVTGPTGSGKTTTLYAALQELNEITEKVLTVEDPVEYDIDGLCQVQVNSDVGLTFASALRSFLRQDPDIILVGETRDLETAQIAVQASLTGHLVFTTLHTNDAPSSIARLLDLGLESFLLTATIEGILAQRLIRKVCQRCKEEYTPTEDELMRLMLRPEDLDGRQLYRGVGCDYCNQSGYKGRMGIFELMVLDDDLRTMIMQNASTQLLAAECRKRGMRTLRQSGLLALYDGLTSLDEIVRETIVDF